MGSGAGVGHAAGKRPTLTGRPVSGQVTPSASGYRGHPPRSSLDRVERDNPVGSPGGLAWCVDREGGAVPQRAKDDPTSECRWPKGDRKPGLDAGSSAGGPG